MRVDNYSLIVSVLPSYPQLSTICWQIANIYPVGRLCNLYRVMDVNVLCRVIVVNGLYRVMDVNTLCR